MSERFYTSDPLGLGEYTLRGPEAHHLATVRRGRVGDAVTLFNGDGKEYAAIIVDAGKKAVTLLIDRVSAPDRELPHPVVIASAIPKGDRADFMIEKLTELGVTRFLPLITTRSVVQPKSIDRFQRSVIEASKQSGRNVLMQVDEPRTWPSFLAIASATPKRVILHPAEDSQGAHVRRDQAVMITIGPEGGFTHEELAQAAAAGFQSFAIGKRIMRIETAAIVAAVLFASQ